MIVSALGHIAPKTAHDHGPDSRPRAPRGPGALPPWRSPPAGAPAGPGLPPGRGSRRAGAPAGPGLPPGRGFRPQAGLPARAVRRKDLELMPCHKILADISLN